MNIGTQDFLIILVIVIFTIFWLYSVIYLIRSKEKNKQTIGLIFLICPIVNSLIIFLCTEILNITAEIVIFMLSIVLLLILIPICYSLKKKINKIYILSFVLFSFIVILVIFLSFASCAGCGEPSKDAIIKSSMDQLRTAAEVYKATTGEGRYSFLNYNVDANNCDIENTFLATGTDGDRVCDETIEKFKGGLIIRINNGIDDNAKYCVQKTLNAGGSFCVDFTGYAGTNNYCDSVNFTCEKD